MRVREHYGQRPECSNKHKAGGDKDLRHSVKKYMNRGTHGGSLLILSGLPGLSRKPPLQEKII